MVSDLDADADLAIEAPYQYFTLRNALCCFAIRTLDGSGVQANVVAICSAFLTLNPTGTP
jgi:hypothetical protein